MPKAKVPVYNINDFKKFEQNSDFYANTLAAHLATHHFIHTPHRHDFYITVLFISGSGTHEIDFLSYPVKAGSVFFLSPGQTHNWKLSKNCEGYIFFHSAPFYDLNFAANNIRDFPFFASAYNRPLLELTAAERKRTAPLFSELLAEYRADAWMRQNKLCSLASLIYIDLSRAYAPLQQGKKINPVYLNTLAVFESLLASNFKTLKLPKNYAALLHISEKHLNRICRECLGKTTTDVISDRILLEAKRLLITSKLAVSQVAAELGYFDPGYFSRLFKKKCRQTPMEFAQHYKEL